jgi:hypothetical protein
MNGRYIGGYKGVEFAERVGGHRQLNGLRQVHPFKSISSGTCDTGHLGPDSEGLSSGLAVSGSGGVGGTAEEVSHLIMSLEEALGLTR